jgi:hypothetical protein
MGSNFNPALAPVEALPAPKDPNIQFTPPPPEVGANMPGNQRGWATGGGQAAGLAADFLHGWMVGKYMHDQRTMKNAVAQIGNSKAALDTTVASAANLINSGKTENDPEVQKAKAAVNGAYQAWLKNAQQYVAPPEAQGVGGKLKAGLKKAFLPQGPELFQQASLTALAQSDPWNLVQQKSVQQKAAESTAQAAATTATVAAGEATGKQQAQAALTQANNELAEAQASGDPKRIQQAQAKAETAKANLQTQTGTPSIPVYGATAVQQQGVRVAGAQLGNEEQTLQSKKAAMEALTKGALPSQLAPDQQYALSGQLFTPASEAELQSFLKNVKTPTNPDGKYATQEDAVQKFMETQRRAMLLSRYAPTSVQIYQNTQERLAAELQNPQAVEQYKKKYPNIANQITQLQPGQPAPSALVDFEADSRIRATPEERYAAQQNAQEGNLLKTIGATGINRLRGEIVDDVVRANPDWQRFRQDAGSTTTGMYSAPIPGSAVKSGWFERDSTARAEYQKFQNALIDSARNKGLSQDELQQVFPGAMPQSMTAPPGGGMTPPPGAPQASMTPPPGPPPPSAAPRRYAFRGPDGTTQYRTLTPSQADAAKKAAGEGVTITPQ